MEGKRRRAARERWWMLLLIQDLFGGSFFFYFTFGVMWISWNCSWWFLFLLFIFILLLKSKEDQKLWIEGERGENFTLKCFSRSGISAFLSHEMMMCVKWDNIIAFSSSVWRFHLRFRVVAVRFLRRFIIKSSRAERELKIKSSETFYER